MKKLFTLILVALLIPLSFIQLKASEPEDYTVYYEQKSLIDKMVIISGGATVDENNYASTGYLTLAMGSSTTFNIDLSNFQNMFSYFDADNIASVVIDFELGSVYTGVPQENQQWVSTYPNWDIASQSITFDLEDLPSSMSVVAWWNVIGESGGAPSIKPGSLRFYSANIIVNYTAPVLLYETITNFSDIPDTNGAYTLVQFTPNNDGTFRALFNGIDGVMYLVSSMELPDEVGSPEYAYFYTDNGFNYLFFALGSALGQTVENIMVNKDWLCWNLDTGAWELTRTYTVHGKTYASGNGITSYNKLYVDLIIPFDVENLLSITFNYEYRYRYLIETKPGEWQTVTNQTLLNGAKSSSGNTPWWSNFVTSYFVLLNTARYITTSYITEGQIVDITSDVDAEYKSDYVQYMQENGTGTYSVNSIFMPDFKAYKIYLGQFDRFGSNGIEARNIAIVNMRVQLSGDTELVLNYPKQDIVDTGEANVPNLTPDFDVLKTVISQALLWLLKNPGIALLVLLVVSNWIYPIFMAAFNGVEKLGKIVNKLFTPRGAIIAVLIFIAYYFFMR